MKYTSYWLMVILVIVVSILSFVAGRSYQASYSLETKSYEAACLQADFIRYLIDHFDGETECANIGMEIEECYYDWFDGLDTGSFKTKFITNTKDLNEYYWCY